MSSQSATTRIRPAESPVKPGDLVAGKYRVEQVLGAGGMGVVVAAQHEELDQPVAIKFLLQHMAIDQMISRFLREARASAKIQSPHVVRVYDCGKLDDGTPYMVMERLDGVELRDELRRRGPFPVTEAVDTIVEALEGVAEAHAKGIVHRDLKPSNLFLAGRGTRMQTVKVLDFGISKIREGPDSPVDDELTGTSMMLGSPRYISPEQAKSSKSVDGRADIWSIGVILYELLTGLSPFAGNTMGEVLGKVLLYTPPPIEEHRDDVPEGLQGVLERCLERNANDRFQNVSELATALAPFGTPASQTKAERIAEIIGEAEALPTWSDQPEPGDDSPGPRRDGSTLSPDGPTVGSWVQPNESKTATWRSSRWVLAAVGLVAGVSLGLWVYTQPGTPESSRDASSAVPVEVAAPLQTSAPTASTAERTATPPASTPSHPDGTPSGAPSESASSASVQPPPAPPPTTRPVPPPPTSTGKPAPGVLDRSD